MKQQDLNYCGSSLKRKKKVLEIQQALRGKRVVEVLRSLGKYAPGSLGNEFIDLKGKKQQQQQQQTWRFRRMPSSLQILHEQVCKTT